MAGHGNLMFRKTEEGAILSYSLCDTPQSSSAHGRAEAFFTTKAVGRKSDVLCPLLGVAENRFTRPHQVHGVIIRQVAEEFFLLDTRIRKMLMEGVDAVIYDVTEACIGVSTADCIPVLCYDKEHHCAAAIHAGWRGSLERIVMRTLDTMALAYGTMAENVVSIIGPGISLDSFEVGDEVYDAFLAKGFQVEAFAERRLTRNVMPRAAYSDALPMKWHIDLKECNRLQLVEAGVPDVNIMVSDIDTMTDGRFYSARREGAETGRMLSGIVLH